MKLKNWCDVITLDFPKPGVINKETVELIKQESLRFRGNMRMATGRIWEDEAFEKYRRQVLSTPLP